MRALTLTLVAGLALPLGALAATLNVNSTADTLVAADGQCTLREAVINANSDADSTAGDCVAGNGADLINVPAGTYTLAIAGADEAMAVTGDLDITSNVTVRGAGASVTRIDAAALDRVLEIQGAVVSVERLTISGGDYPVTPLPYSFVGLGGGILNALGTLTLLNSVVADNRGACAPTGFGNYICGAGIYAVLGTTTVRRSAVVNNDGGGIRLGVASPDQVTTLLVENSTISGNTVSCLGFGSAIDDAHTNTDLEIRFSTIAGNYTDSACGVPGAVTGFGNIKASVISNPGSGSNCWGLHSDGHNIDSDGSCALTDPTDLSNVDPLLGPLQSNGGPTPTHALLQGSPAIDRIPSADCTWDHDGNVATPEVTLTKDQRGGDRPREGNGASPTGCDVGAYEVAACADGLDNDGDALVDFDGGTAAGISPLASPDSNCSSALGSSEAPPPPPSPGCGLGPELAPALLWLVLARRRSRLTA